MIKRVLTLAAILLVSCNGNQEKSTTFQNQGNPLFRDAFTADPAPLVASDGRLYVFCGHDEQFDDLPGYEGKDGYNITEWLCYSTADMQNWTAHGAVLSPADFSWANGEACSAQCIEVNGKYYLYASLQNDEPDVKAIGVAVADKPEGPYKDALGKPLILDANHPTVFIDSDGSPWLCWGSEICYLARLQKNMTALEGEIFTIALDHFKENPWLYKRNGQYYLVYSSMGPGRETLSYAMAGNLHGPWECKGEFTGMAEDSFTIHPGVIEFGGKSYLFYHNATLSLDNHGPATGRRSVCMDQLQYNADGTIKPLTQTRDGA